MTDPTRFRGGKAVQLIGDSRYGGAVPVVLGLMRVMSEKGLQTELLATDSAVVAAAQAEGWTVWQFPGIVRSPRPLRDLVTAVRLAAELRSRKVRVLHTHTSKGGMIGRLAGRLAGCDVVIHHTHGFYHTGMRPGLARQIMAWLEWFFGKLDDYQVFVNTMEADEAVRLGITPSAKARVVFNGQADPLDGEMPDCAHLRASWGVPEDAVVLGSVSRLAIEQKGLDTALVVFRGLLDRVPNAWYVLAGGGDDRERLEELAQELGVRERLVFLGHVAGAGAFHRCFDVTFAPSRREGQSISVIEAMACSTAVVTTDIPGTHDLVVDSTTGLLCDVDDVDALTDALVRVLLDRTLADRMGSAGRERYLTHFTEDAFMDRVRKFYDEALGGDGR